jgi:phosphopantothenoylcysteine decarboxylase / phosphopantothenate---cysteine ligase
MQRPQPHTPTPPRLLVTSGPTQEPIDAVRFIGNKSSGRLGAAIADAADTRNWTTTILLGNQAQKPARPAVEIVPFRTTADLETLLATHVPQTDILIMAAAVADYRPTNTSTGKLRRTGKNLTLELEPTPDLLAECSAMREPHHTFVGFALEPRDSLLANAQAKLERKNLDLIVANPLETMDSDTIEATILGQPDSPFATPRTTNAPISKPEFAAWLLDAIAELAATHTVDTTND